jgi:hypothetical protein
MPDTRLDHDLPLLEGEKENIREEAIDVAGKQWLYEPNAYLGGQSPEQVIEAGRPGLIRGFLRTIKYVGFS